MMKSEVKIFNNPQFGEVRAKMVNDQPFFAGIDIASILGYEDKDQAIRTHVDDEDKRLVQLVDFQDPLKQTPPHMKGSKLMIINESGVYSLIFGSTLPSAKAFRKWVTSEVLPSIRKHGAYLSNEAIEKALADPDTLIKLATNLKDERQKRLTAESKVKEQAPQVLFAQAVETSDKCILVGELAKIINQNGVNIGQNRLFTWMREKGYLCSKGELYNQPTQRAMDMGLFEVKKTTITKPNGTSLVTTTTKVTGKGQIYFVNKFLYKQENQ